MLNLNDLYIFVQVIDHGGFAPAARQLKVPKSTLSKRTAELEKNLGVRLITRTTRRFVPTDIGRELYRHAAAMLVEAEAAEELVQGRLAEPSGTVRITCSVPTAQISLADLLPGLALSYPKLHVVLHATDRFVDIVQERFDIAVRDHFAPLPDSDLIQRQIGEQATYLVAAPAYLARKGEPRVPEDLKDHDALLSSLGSDHWDLENREGDRFRVQPPVRFTADESQVLLQAARAGLGITCLPDKFCTKAFAKGTLARVLPDWTAGKVRTSLLMPHRRGLLPSVRAAADYLADCLLT